MRQQAGTRIVGNWILLGSMVLAGVLPAVTAKGQAAAVGQAAQSITLNENQPWHGRSYLLELRSHGIVDQTNWWHGDDAMQAYAKAHPGESYLLFVQDDTLYRLDAQAELASLAELHQPLEHLAGLQSELAAAMAPLSSQQQSLGEQMRATRDPRVMARIGHEQGIIGARQGEIGRQQGVIGRQQGMLGRAFYQSTQELIDRCLKDNSCSAVGSAAPAAAQR